MCGRVWSWAWEGVEQGAECVGGGEDERGHKQGQVCHAIAAQF